jgi:hypothetical protein
LEYFATIVPKNEKPGLRPGSKYCGVCLLFDIPPNCLSDKECLFKAAIISLGFERSFHSAFAIVHTPTISPILLISSAPVGNPILQLYVQHAELSLTCLLAQAQIEALTSALIHLDPRGQATVTHFLEAERHKRREQIEELQKLIEQYRSQTSLPPDSEVVN